MCELLVKKIVSGIIKETMIWAPGSFLILKISINLKPLTSAVVELEKMITFTHTSMRGIFIYKYSYCSVSTYRTLLLLVRAAFFLFFFFRFQFHRILPSKLTFLSYCPHVRSYVCFLSDRTSVWYFC